VYRLYTEANLTVRKRKKVRRPPAERTPLNIATKVNEVWSMDFSMVRPGTASSNWWL
jgi:putative transposase